MTPDENDAVEAFERLGLTGYEAKTFIALQRLGTGTARDVARETDVPRSQVYAVAEGLEERGLLAVQQSNPIRYRPVSVDEARDILRDRFEREQERAFEYVETVREISAGEEEREDIWTVRGGERVDGRIVDLCSDATDRVVFGSRLPELVTPAIERTLAERASEGLSVTVLSRSAAVRDRFEDVAGVTTAVPPDARTDDRRSGRLVIVDDDTVLLSVVDDGGEETGVWSAKSIFATVLIQLIEASVDTPDSIWDRFDETPNRP